VRTGAAWREFCDRLKAAGDLILADGAPRTELQTAEGYRYLTRLLRMGLEMVLEYGDPLAPELFYQNPTLKSGGDNPDNFYHWGRIRGTHDYRIAGVLQPCEFLTIDAYAGGLNKEGGRRTVAHLGLPDLRVGADGRFEVTLSQHPRPDGKAGNWMQITEDTGTVLIRETVADRATAPGSSFTLSRLDREGPPPPLDAERLAKALRSVSGFVTYSATFFAGMANKWAARPNDFFGTDTDAVGSTFGNEDLQYLSCYFRIPPGSALLVEFAQPGDAFWSLVLHNHWFESLDYLHRRIHTNQRQYGGAGDGTVRLVLAERDPGIEGTLWLDTEGHTEGIAVLRVVEGPPQALPTTRLVAL
jgi:hypothetical protein